MAQNIEERLVAAASIDVNSGTVDAQSGFSAVTVVTPGSIYAFTLSEGASPVALDIAVQLRASALASAVTWKRVAGVGAETFRILLVGADLVTALGAPPNGVVQMDVRCRVLAPGALGG